ncbi:hypothetical protein [Agrococcus jejuensis]|uniref:Uncharacterized protein n=1 Tax=Agrococcus jejuensis TaxID=399736 RepID=A0A1G8DII0_9MICO|nr:hypothetical protein [Agrococcus jejuensis]SDH57478.1 hypothetical protein SAMN04489720_1660 [Agrococcus jejuensis]
MARRQARALRGVVVASLATFAALLSHVSAGGAMPGPVGIVVPLTLAIFASVLLSGAVHSLWRLVPSVAASQLLFHALFVLGTPTASLGVSGHAHHASDADLSAALAASSGGAAMTHAMHADATMWLHHAIAAAATIALIARGERALARLAAFAFFVLRRLVVVLVPVRPTAPVALAATWAAPRAWSLSRRQAPSLLRGPPAALAS